MLHLHPTAFALLALWGLPALAHQVPARPDAAVAEDPVGENPGENPDFRARARLHYARALRELERADVSALDAGRRAARAELIAELERYRERGEFGRNTDFPGERMPYFVDAGGRRCAVANLLDFSGEGEYVLSVAAARNNHYICEMVEDPALNAWLDRVGLSMVEAARIHVPVPPPRRQPPGYAGPGDTVGAPNIPSASGARAPATAAPSAPGPARAAPVTRGGFDPIAAAIPTRTTVMPDWWTWWEMNKLEYLSPNRLRMAPTTGYRYGDDLPRDLSLDLRGELLPLLREGIADPNGQVRAAATVALGRVAGPEAMPFLREMLQDPDLSVRRRAILALGASASKPATALLLDIAVNGDDARSECGGIAPNARALAIVALGLARREGADAELDVEVAELFDAERRNPSSELANAVLVYHQLAPNAHTAEIVARVAEGKRGASPSAAGRSS